MRPVKTGTATGVLTLLDEDGVRMPDRDLPFERVVDEAGQAAIETTWQPEDGERRALANGAPVRLLVWGLAHPPVAVQVGEPAENAVPLVGEGEAGAALAFMYTRLAGFVAEQLAGEALEHGVAPPAEELVPDVETFLRWWQRGLALSRDAARYPAEAPDAPEGA